MKKGLICVLALIFIVSCGTSYATTILIYHKIGDSRTPTTNVSTALFKQQMEYLYKNHYKVLPLASVVETIKQHKKLPKKSVVITFDDGYKTVYKNAFPIIKKYLYPTTIFLPTEAVEKHYPDYMTLNQIKEMQKYKADFQSHSYSHPRMAYKPKNASRKQYTDFIKKELIKSISFFEKYLHYKPYAFAIPYGEYNKTVINEALKCGFEAILTQDTGAVSDNTPLYLIPREPILGKYWSTMKHFKYVLNNEEYLPIKKRMPDIGITNCKNITAGAVIKNIENYKNFKIYTSPTGWIDAKKKGDFVYIDNISACSRKKIHIGISAADKNNLKDAKVFWMVVISSRNLN